MERQFRVVGCAIEACTVQGSGAFTCGSRLEFLAHLRNTLQAILLAGSEDLLSIITPIRIPFRVLVTLLITYLLSPPTLQVGINSLCLCDRNNRGIFQQDPDHEGFR